MKVNAKTKLIETFAVSDAAVHDSQCLEPLVEARRDGVLHADSAYRSAAISALQQAQNTQRSRVRARVEHVFGFICGVMGPTGSGASGWSGPDGASDWRTWFITSAGWGSWATA